MKERNQGQATRKVELRGEDWLELILALRVGGGSGVDQKFQYGYFKLEMSIRHPSRNVK